MIDLYIVRHGQTEWNVQKRMQGRWDSPLTEKGKKDAERLRDSLMLTVFTNVFSSPSGRAHTTARILQPNNNRIITDDRLMEIHLGNWQGKTEAEIKHQYPIQFHHYWNAPERYRNDKGETFRDVMVRVDDFLQNIERTYPSGRVLIVTHGVAIMAIIAAVKKLTVEDFWSSPPIEGTSLTLIRLERGERRLLMEGSLEHLNPLKVKGNCVN